MKVDIDIELVHKLGIHHESVAVIIYNKNKELLFIKRNKNKLGGGKWEIPATHSTDTGYFNDGLSCVERELGIRNVSLSYLGKFDYCCKIATRNGGMVENETVHVLLTELAEYESGSPQNSNDDIEDYKWFSLDKLVERINKEPEEFCFWTIEGVKALTTALIEYFQLDNKTFQGIKNENFKLAS